MQVATISLPGSLKALLLVSCVLYLAGCGFHLRGAVALPEAMQVTSIEGIGLNSDVGREVRKMLEASGAQVAASPTERAARLKLSGDRFDRRVLSVGTTGKAREYELHYRLDYSLADADGVPLVPENSVDLTRSYLYDPENVLGTEQEEEALRREMRQLAVRQMLRQIQVQLRRAPSGGSVQEPEAAGASGAGAESR